MPGLPPPFGPMRRCLHAGTLMAMSLVLSAAAPSKPAARAEASRCRFEVSPRTDSTIFESLQVLDPTHLLATDRKCLYASENGGKAFQQVRCAPFAPEADAVLSRFYFLDRAVGWALTGDARLWHTRDGGVRWEALSFPSHLVYDVRFADAQTGFWVGEGWELGKESHPAVFMTRDGGGHWSPVTLPSDGGSPTRFEGVWMKSASEVWVVGDRMLTSTNAGQTWRKMNINARLAGELRNTSIQFGGGGVGWISRYPVENYLLTCDGGKSWATRPLRRGMGAFLHTDCGHAYALQGGKILGSQDGGRTFQVLLEGGGEGMGYGYSALAYLEEKRLLVAVSERTVATCQLDAP